MLTGYQLKNARLLLQLSQKELGSKLGRCSRAVSNWEMGHTKIRRDTELAIKFLLTESGLYAHFRIVYMRKDKLISTDLKQSRVVKDTNKRKKQEVPLVYDALAFKFGS